MAPLFVSYARADRMFLDMFIPVIRRVYGNDSIWFDDDIYGGTDWWLMILEQISKCDAFVYLISNESLESPYCQAELREAIRLDKPILPVIVRRLKPAYPGNIDRDVASFLRNVQYVDLTNGFRDPDTFAALYAAINRLLRSVTDAPPTPRIGHPVPEPIVPDKTVDSSDFRATYIAGIFSLLAAIIAGVFTLWQSAFEGEIPTVDVEIPFWSLPVLVLLLSTFNNRLLDISGIFTATVISAYVIYPAENNLFSNEFILVSVLAVLGLVVGRTKILMSPFLSWRAYRLAAALKKKLRGTKNVIKVIQSDPELNLRLLDASLPYTPAGYKSAMSVLASAGLLPDQFSLIVDNSQRREQYRSIVHRNSLEAITNCNILVEVASIQGLVDVSRQAQKELQHHLDRLNQTEDTLGSIEEIIAIIRYFESELKELPTTARQTAFPEETKRAYQYIVSLTYHSSEPYVRRYWQLHDDLSDVIQLAQNTRVLIVEKNYELAPAISKIEETIESLEDIAPLETLSSQERQWYLGLLDVLDILKNFSESFDYARRQELLNETIAKLRETLASQPKSWTVIDRHYQAIQSVDNNWRLLMQEIIELLHGLSEKNQNYVEQTALQIEKTLRSISTMLHISELDEELEPLLSFDASYSPLIDNLLSALIDIGSNTDAALEYEDGNRRRIESLRDVHHQVNRLHDSLKHVYSSHADRWCTLIHDIGEIIDEHLSQQEQIEQEVFGQPYIVGNPVPATRSALFKGRRDIVDQLINRFRHGSRPTIILHGARRMGKSSFLNQLQNLLYPRTHYVTVPCSLQRGGMLKDDASFFYQIASESYKQAKAQLRNKDLAKPVHSDFVSNPALAFDEWLEEQIVPVLNGKMLFIMIDEYEKIIEKNRVGALSDLVLDTLRGLMQDKEYLLLLFAGIYRLKDVSPEAITYFIGAQEIEVGYLDEESSIELITNPDESIGSVPTYDDAAVARIIELTHCHPYLIQAVCSKLIDKANNDSLTNISVALVDGAVQQVFKDYPYYFEDLWLLAANEGQKFLHDIANGKKAIMPEFSDSDAFRKLEYHRVIERFNDSEYKITVPIFERWVKMQSVPS